MYLDKWSLLGILIMLLLACLMFMLVLLLVWWYCSSPALLLQAALKAAQQTKDGREDEITILRTEIEVSSCYSLGAVCFFYCHWSSFLLLFFFFCIFFLFRTWRMTLQMQWNSFRKLKLKPKLFEQWHREWFWPMKRWLLFEFWCDKLFAFSFRLCYSLPSLSYLDIYCPFDILGGGGSKEMLAFSILGPSCTIW